MLILHYGCTCYVKLELWHINLCIERDKLSSFSGLNNIVFMYLQCSPFVSAQQLGKRVFQTGRALAGIIPLLRLLNAFYVTEICHILIHFIQIHLPLLHHEHKDQSLIKRMDMNFFSFTS